MAPFRILSLDGGGIRGLIPALVLAALEQRTGKPTAQLFDLIAGTSTGGVLALGLTRPGPGGKPLYRADDMVGAQMVWLNVVRTRFSGRVEPAESEIDAELAQRTSAASTEYLISEIGLPLQGDGRTADETRALADRLSETLNQGGDFQQAVARL